MSCTNEQFLFCVIDHSVSGKVDWQAVGDVFGIKQSAAYMRFSRMKAKCGDYPGSGKTTSAKTTPAKTTPKKDKKAVSGETTTSKQRNTQIDADDEELAACHSEMKKVKSEVAAKEESEDDGWA